MIFRRFQGRRLDWIYHFPKLYAVDLRPLKEALDENHDPDWLNYSPSEALAKEEEDKEQDKNLAEMRKRLRRDIAGRSRRPSKARRRQRSGLTRRSTAAFHVDGRPRREIAHRMREYNPDGLRGRKRAEARPGDGPGTVRVVSVKGHV